MRRPGSTPASPTLSIHSVQAATILNKNSLFIEITLEGKKNIETLALIDSGAGGKFIDQNFARKEKFEMKDLENPLVVYNVDGTLNKTGTIRKYVDLQWKENNGMASRNWPWKTKDYPRLPMVK